MVMTHGVRTAHRNVAETGMHSWKTEQRGHASLLPDVAFPAGFLLPSMIIPQITQHTAQPPPYHATPTTTEENPPHASSFSSPTTATEQNTQANASMADKKITSPPMDEAFAAAQHQQEPCGRTVGGLGDSLMVEEQFVQPPEGRPASTPAAGGGAGEGIDPLHATEEALAGAAEWVKEKAAGAWQAVKAGTVTGGHKTAEGLSTVKDKVGEALGLARDKAASAAHTVAEKAKEATSPVRERASRGYLTKKEEGKETTAAMKAQVVGKAEEVTDATKAKVGGVVERGREAGAQVSEKVHETGQRVAENAEAAKEGIAAVGGKIQSTAQAAKEHVQSGMHTAKVATQETTEAVAERMGGAAGKISGWMEGMAGEVQHRPKVQEGGRVGPVPVGFGEPQLHEHEEESGIKVRGGGKAGKAENEGDSVKALAHEVATSDMA